VNTVTRTTSRLALAAAIVLGTFTTAAAQHTPQGPKAPWMNTSLDPDTRADLVIKEMTLNEKIMLVRGTGGFALSGPRSNGGGGMNEGVARLGIPLLQYADSAVGVRSAAERGRYATLMPSAVALASTWDLTLGFTQGDVIGRELRDQLYNTSVGGGVNLIREPRNGRTFEYLGEDPVLAGKMAAQWVKGIQNNQVIGDIKHYAANDQETGRTVVNVKMDKRTARETDLLAFEIAITEGQPGMVMCSYNKFNGDYACENSYLLNDVLKKAWGFKGFVISDWWATHSTVKAAMAGLDNEEPNSRYFGEALKTAVEDGVVPMARLNDMVHRILRTEFAMGVVDNPPRGRVVNPFKGAATSQLIAEQASVLLKNAANQLPLAATKVKSIALFGSRADSSVLSGGGSAQVDPPGGDPSVYGGPAVWFPSSPLESIRAKAPAARVEYNDGSDLAKAAALAKSSQVAIVFVNQPISEGKDQPTLALPKDSTAGDHPVTIDQDALVAAVAAANPRTIVVLETGAPVAMPWIEKVGAALEIWYPGVRGAEALANILFGDVNPCAKLPVTFARADADLPNPTVPGINLLKPGAPGSDPVAPPFDLTYSEGLKVGYKWFDAEGKTPLFAFGHGLSYTTFAYSALKAGLDSVTFTVKNTGKRAGAEIAQVYAGLPAAAQEPPRRLVAWEKVLLKPGESKTITLPIDPKFMSVFNEQKDNWELLTGDYTLSVGGSSRDLPLKMTVSK
jgi:beta-glucosidase